MRVYDMSDIQKLEMAIAALIPSHPEILQVTDARDLFDIDGFKESLPKDHDLTFVHAQMVLNTVKRKYREGAYGFTARDK